MSHPLLNQREIDIDPGDYLRSAGTVFVEFSFATQDSGNISYGVEIDGRRYFVKTAGDRLDTRSFLSHSSRVELLRNAVRLSQTCRHFTLAGLYQVIESPSGPLLVYEWLEGELLRATRAERDNPAS